MFAYLAHAAILGFAAAVQPGSLQTYIITQVLQRGSIRSVAS